MIIDTVEEEKKIMTLYKFLLHKTDAKELCIIRDCGWIVASCWIDYEDLFIIPDKLKNRIVKKDEWGYLPVVNHNNDATNTTTTIPCHYIDV